MYKILIFLYMRYKINYLIIDYLFIITIIILKNDVQLYNPMLLKLLILWFLILDQRNFWAMNINNYEAFVK